MPQEIALIDLAVSINFDCKPKSGIYEPAKKLSQHILNKSWSPIIFKDNRRLESNFLYSDWAILDYENGSTLEEARNTFCDCIHLIGTTKSHTKEAHRFRVCIPWSERITDLATFKYNQTRFIEDHDTDAQCKDGARFYFPCTTIYSANIEGFRVDVKPPPKAEEIVKNYTVESTGFSQLVNFFMKNKMNLGDRNKRVYQVAKDLLRIGLDKQVVGQIILRSPTYRDNIEIPPSLKTEITDTINSAWRSLKNG